MSTSRGDRPGLRQFWAGLRPEGRWLLSTVAVQTLGRGLTLQDSCTVDSIVAELERGNYSAYVLIDAVVTSAPFRPRAQECSGP